MPSFIDAKNLQRHIKQELRDGLKQIEYQIKTGRLVSGYDATILPMICGVYLDARREDDFKKSQEWLAVASEILLRGFAHVGITALIDEATGYQYFRERKALEKILERFISEDLIRWAKTFPDELYREMFRLKGWPYDPSSVKRPSVVGKYTNDLVYERLAPGVLNELRRKNPPGEKGRRKYKHFQWLTEDVGHPRLREHLSAIIALMKAFTDWRKFMSAMNRALPKHNTTPDMFPEHENCDD